MTQPNKRTVERRSDGNYEVRKPGAERASALRPTQSAAITRGREILRNSGGGELAVRGNNGQIRAQDTIKPGNDPPQQEGLTVNDDGVAAALARLMGLPAWLPRAILRTAMAVVAAAFIVAPDTAKEALAIYVNTQTERITDIMGPFLTPTPSPTAK